MTVTPVRLLGATRIAPIQGVFKRALDQWCEASFAADTHRLLRVAVCAASRSAIAQSATTQWMPLPQRAALHWINPQARELLADALFGASAPMADGVATRRLQALLEAFEPVVKSQAMPGELVPATGSAAAQRLNPVVTVDLIAGEQTIARWILDPVQASAAQRPAELARVQMAAFSAQSVSCAVTLGTAEVALSDLLHATPGDVLVLGLPLSARAQIQSPAGDAVIAKATLARRAERRALVIQAP